MKICNMCGNKINDTESMCPICGNILGGLNQQPVNNGMHYNHQNPAYSQQNNVDMQQQYNNMNQQYQQPMMNQQYNQIQNPNKTKTSDVVGGVITTIGLFYALNILLVLHQGLDEFINNNLSDPKYADVKNDPGLMAFSITWVALFAGIISLIIGLKNKKLYKNCVNKYNIFGGLASLAIAIGSMIYIYNFLS